MPSDEVDMLLIERSHPLATTIEAVRARLLALAGVIESVKWNSPNYALADDFATLNLRRDTAVQLILHTGARVKPDHPDIVLHPFPVAARRADRNRVILSFARLPDPHELSELAGTLESWTAQLV